MEKNGAISSDTPCCRGRCKTFAKRIDIPADIVAKQEQLTQKIAKQKSLFPENSEEADAIEYDLTKQAIDSVVNESKKQ